MLSFEILIYTYIVLQMIRKENIYLLKKINKTEIQLGTFIYNVTLNLLLVEFLTSTLSNFLNRL